MPRTRAERRHDAYLLSEGGLLGVFTTLFVSILWGRWAALLLVPYGVAWAVNMTLDMRWGRLSCD